MTNSSTKTPSELIALADDEKNTISSLLERAEKEISCYNPFVGLSELEIRSKELWPNWHQTTFDYDTATYVSLTTIFDPINSPGTDQNARVTFGNRGYLHKSPDNVDKKLLMNDNKKGDDHLSDSSAHRLADECDKIKDELTDLMNRLASICHTDDVPELVEAEYLNPADFDDDYDYYQYEMQDMKQSPLKRGQIRCTKQQMRQRVINRQREVLHTKADNARLKAELLKHRAELYKSQKNIEMLRNELKKSEIIYKEIKMKKEREKKKDFETFDPTVKPLEPVKTTVNKSINPISESILREYAATKAAEKKNI